MVRWVGRYSSIVIDTCYWRTHSHTENAVTAKAAADICADSCYWGTHSHTENAVTAKAAADICADSCKRLGLVRNSCTAKPWHAGHTLLTLTHHEHGTHTREAADPSRPFPHPLLPPPPTIAFSRSE
jgi:hypothetical protein